MVMIGFSVPSAGATPGPSGYGFDGTAHTFVGGGSDTTWKIMLSLSTDYNIAPGCANTPPNPLPISPVLDVCSSPVPTVNSLGNFDHDTSAQAYPTGSSIGIEALNQDHGGVSSAACTSGGVAVSEALDPAPCGPTSAARFASDGATTDASATVTSTAAAFANPGDVGKPIRGETAIPSGAVITAVGCSPAPCTSTTATMSSAANGTKTGVVLEIGSSGPSLSYARSSRGNKTSGGNCVGGVELTCDTFWGFAQDGIEVSAFNDSFCLGNFTSADLLSIWNGTTKTWGALAALDAGTNALCVAGRAGTDPIIPWGMNTGSGTFGTFQGFIGATSPVPSSPGVDQGLHDSTSNFPFENDIKPIVNDVTANGIPAPVSGAACAAGVPTAAALTSPCNPDNWLWWGSFGVFKAFPYESSFSGITHAALSVNGRVPSSSNILANTYSYGRTLYHVTKKADADCAKTAAACDFTGNPGPAIGTGAVACLGGGTGANCDLNVTGAPGAAGVSGAVREFTRWLCRPNGADQAIDPFTGVNYDTVITSDIAGSGFTKVPATLLTGGAAATRCHVVS